MMSPSIVGVLWRYGRRVVRAQGAGGTGAGRYQRRGGGLRAGGVRAHADTRPGRYGPMGTRGHPERRTLQSDTSERVAPGRCGRKPPERTPIYLLRMATSLADCAKPPSGCAAERRVQRLYCGLCNAFMCACVCVFARICVHVCSECT